MPTATIRKWLSTEARLSRRRLPRFCTLALFYVLAMTVLYGHLALWPQQFRVGQVVPYTIFAPVAFVYADSQKLAELTGSLRAGEPLAVLDTTMREKALAQFQAFQNEFMVFKKQLLGNAMSSAERETELNALALKYVLDRRVLTHFLTYPEDVLSGIFSDAREQLGTEMESVVTDDYINTLRRGGVAALFSTPNGLYAYFLRPNLTEIMPPDISDERSKLAQVPIAKGSAIIAEGTVVDQRAKEQLEALKPHLLEQNLYRFLGLGLLVLAAIVLWHEYLLRFLPRILASTSSVAQLCALFLAALVLGLVLGRLPFDYFYYSVTLAVAALATLVVLVYDALFATYLALGLGLVLSVGLNFGTGLTLYTMATALLPPVFLGHGAPRRRQVLFSLALGFFNMLLAAVVILVTVQTLHWQVFAIAFLTGFAAGIVALGLLPIMETLTSNLTIGKLTDLANPENELLKRLKQEAHGTYVHSQMVADLTEEGVKAIGGHALLARVGALYHDIGKLKRPGFFAENIHDLSKNPHSSLPPETSVRILKDHVSDGLVMAADTGLPRDLHHFISEHHGTYLIKYFYYQAVRLHDEQPAKYAAPVTENFVYEGPVPQDKESGVLMLADITEALTRSRTDADAAEIRQLVDQVVADKIEEQQLVESSLTLGDLEQVKQAFTTILLAQRHHRVLYPEQGPAPLHFHLLGKETPPPHPANGRRAHKRSDAADGSTDAGHA